MRAGQAPGFLTVQGLSLRVAVEGRGQPLLLISGLGASLEVVGLNFYHTAGFSVGYGFDSIAVALLGRGDPFGVIPSALLFGALRAGASRMQFLSQIPIDIINIIQALVLIFVAAPALIRWIYRVRVPREAASVTGEVQLTTGWGKAET